MFQQNMLWSRRTSNHGNGRITNLPTLLANHGYNKLIPYKSPWLAFPFFHTSTKKTIMLTEQELDNILIAQKDTLITRIDLLIYDTPDSKFLDAEGIYKTIRLLLPLWDSCSYHYKAEELIHRINTTANLRFPIPQTTKEGVL